MAHKTLIIILTIFLLTATPTESFGENPSPPRLLIYEFHPYAYPSKKNEYVCIANPTNNKISLNGYTLSDGEGILALRGYIKPHSKFYISQTYENFTKVMGFPPNLVYENSTIEGKFSLGNKGDEIILMYNNKIVDSVCYGNSSAPDWIGNPLPKPSPGLVYRRTGFIDTNSAKDWIKRKIYVGQSDFKFSRIFVKGDITFFVLPDCGVDVVLNEMKKARNFILIETYLFTSPLIAKYLGNLANNGVKIKILVEGNPVGGIPKSEKIALSYLKRKGCDVRIMYNNASLKIYDRYTYIHSKFVVIDNETIIVLTENFCLSSLPLRNNMGNRGFGVIVKNSTLAKIFAKIFYDDFSPRKEDSIDFPYIINESFVNYKSIRLRRSIFKPIKLHGSFFITPVLSPDTSYDFISKFLKNSKEIYGEELYIRKDILNLFGENIKGKIILDGSNSTRKDNEKILKILKKKGLEVKIINTDTHKIYRLHAKILANSSGILVGSINLGYFSLTRNREISLFIENRTIIQYFLDVLNYDWKDDVSPPIAKIDYFRNGEHYHFSAERSYDDSGILEYSWYVDGKIISHNPQMNITLGYGEHVVKLVVEDYYGNKDYATLKISVYPVDDFYIIPYIIVFLLYSYAILNKLRKNK